MLADGDVVKRLPDPKPEKRIVDGTVEPLDSGPIDGNYCPVCNAFTLEWQRHHVINRSQGGDDVPENLVWLCMNCHGQIHFGSSAKPRILFLTYLRGLPETLDYVASVKYDGWLEDRYLGVRL